MTSRRSVGMRHCRLPGTAALALAAAWAVSPVFAADSPAALETRLVDAGIEPTRDGLRQFLESLLDPDREKQFERLIADLRDPRFAIREQATRRLMRMPFPPLEKLRAAGRSADFEQAMRAKTILEAVQSAGDTPLLAAMQLIERKRFSVGMPLLASIVQRAPDANTREAAVRAMLATVHDDDRELAKKLLESPELATRNIARRLLARLADPAAAPLLEGSFDAVQLTPGNVSGGGPNLIAGWEFKLRAKATVTHLGIYDDRLNGLSVAHAVAIWQIDRRGEPVVLAVVPAGQEAESSGMFRMVPVDPVELEAGKNYAVVALYPRNADTTVSMVNPSGLNVKFADHLEVIGRRYTFPHEKMVYPTHLGAGEKHATLGPSFRFKAVPEVP